MYYIRRVYFKSITSNWNISTMMMIMLYILISILKPTVGHNSTENGIISQPRRLQRSVSAPQLVLFALLAGKKQYVESFHCPPTCTCAFNFKIDKNSAICNISNTIVDIKWYRILEHPVLSITCQGTNHTCEDLPKFDISHRQAWTEVTSCSPSIVRCFNGIYHQPTIIENMETHNMKGYYTREDLEGLDKVWYVRLYLRDMDTTMPFATIESLPAIKELYIKGGNIHLSKHEYNETTLEYLELYENNIYGIPAGTFKGLAKLKKLRIYDNNLDYLNDDCLNGLESLEELNLQGNKVKYLAVGAPTRTALDLSKLTPESGDLPEPPKLFRNAASLKDINLSHNQIKDIPQQSFSMLEKLENVYLSYNNIENLIGNLFINSSQLKQIYLDHNVINNIDLQILNGTRLLKLDLTFNNLQRIVRDTSFSWQTKLLNLSNNRMEIFEDWFVELTDMEQLDLSNNNIKIIKESELKFTNSRLTIDLRNNNITEIVRDTTETLTTNANISLYLSNNPLRCDCEIITILHDWNEKGLIDDFDEIICNINLNISIVNVKLHCDSSHALVARIGSSVIGALIILLIVISIFTQKTKIQQYLLLFFNRKKETLTSFEMKQNQLKPYDVFISFAHQDQQFVENILLPKLEYEYAQKVCVHYRDWILGEPIPDQITNSVQNSFITIIILTENFIKSNWCNLEFRTAQTLNKEEQISSPLIILLDEAVVENENLDEEIKSYINVKNHVIWNTENFWTKLMTKLPFHNYTKLERR